jgi:hypothetical protein
MPYALKGPQIEPESAHWTYDGYRIRVVDIHTDHPTGNVVPEYETDPILLDYEIQELEFLANNRANAGQISGTFNPVLKPGPGGGSVPDTETRIRYPLSSFLHLRPPPISAQFNTYNWQVPCTSVSERPVKDVFAQCDYSGPLLVTNGQELARLFEAETPGLMHRHALNCLLFERPTVSPVRQARVWMALDIAIYSALLAAWHIKWGHRSAGQPDFGRTYRERPIEYELRLADDEKRPPRFEILFDYELKSDGTERGPRRCPDPDFISPGTPRHPAYPSGHSTYSAAASRILEHFFSPDTLAQTDAQVFGLPQSSQVGSPAWVAAELRRLANNIGMARLWASVHWRQDHTTGRKLGEWVADQIIEQLCHDPVRPLPKQAPDPCDDSIPVPNFQTVEGHKQYRDQHSGGKCGPDQDTLPSPASPDLIRRLQPQRGGLSS